MKRRLFILIIVGLGLIASAWWWRQQAKPAADPAPVAAEQLHPLMIAAMRQRDYPGGQISIERPVATRNGYSSYLVSYPSDELKIYALMNVPAGTPPAGGWPVLILNHGYIQPDQYQTLGNDYSYWIDGLSRAGYIVIKPDYRGHGDSQGQPEGGHWSPAYAADALNLMASLKTYPAANAARVGMIGHSMGANVTLRAIAVSRDIKASAVLAGVVGSAYDLFYNWPRDPNWQPAPGLRQNRSLLIETYGNPQTNPSFWDKVSAINYVAGVAGPVQIHHGTADRTVPVLFSANLAAALQKAGKPVEYFTYEGGDHQFSGNSDLALRRMLEHFNRHL